MSSSATSVRPALPWSVRGSLAVVSALSAVVTVVLAVLGAGQSEASAVDRWALAVIAPSVPEPKADFTPAWFVSTAGDPLVAAVLMVLLSAACWRLGRKRLAALAVAATVVNGVVTTGLKPLIGRTINGDHLSYPSGHTAWLTAMGIVAGLLLADLRHAGRAVTLAWVLGLALVGGAVMGWAQTGTIVHYATDTVGGFCAALALVPAAAWLIDRVADRR